MGKKMPPCRRAQGQKCLLQVQRDGRGLPAAVLLHHGDGAGHLRTMFQIMLPQAMNLGSVIILNSVVGQWNSWLQASIYVPNNKNLWPLQLWIRQITNENQNFLQSSNPDYSRYLVQYAVIVAATLPIIVIFPFFQDKLEKGVIAGGVKG